MKNGMSAAVPLPEIVEIPPHAPRKPVDHRFGEPQVKFRGSDCHKRKRRSVMLTGAAFSGAGLVGATGLEVTSRNANALIWTTRHADCSNNRHHRSPESECIESARAVSRLPSLWSFILPV
jgi:hypothetical protein